MFFEVDERSAWVDAVDEGVLKRKGPDWTASPNVGAIALLKFLSPTAAPSGTVCPSENEQIPLYP